MIKVEFYCDEAGRLGYVDRPENSPGQFTLVAGLIVEEHHKKIISEFCDDLVDRFSSTQKNFILPIWMKIDL
ncbi:hypothetical protein GCM10007916_29480 [Psychromonas marina]|uniref:DUF3800 domain-containing protein n=1 Tax=Psychromonas marina TaxID=88364 RepID=A0ABQ6E393_9GAMM|nr:hypothetical protein [Psychromonas marina]GLS91878.1 hypothetical protein GCM10007916_29480 [Psychromonas marina]